MCGVLAIVTSGRPIGERDFDAAQRMNAAMVRRGPDGKGLLRRNHVLLGHRRLAIRDRDAGTQPMVTPDGRYAISYNGEIYNDAELRHELTQDHGARFETRCDTETLLHAFRIWGKDCVDRLRGMFAFVAVDYQTGRVLVARDRCGVKPLFYTQVDGVLLVASSIASLLEHPSVCRRPNFRAISNYLSSFRLTLGNETMYQNIFQLEPAQRMIVHSGGHRFETYWELPPEDATISFEQAAAELSQGLDEAVSVRQVSDRPVGMLLSGGIDSAAIASSMVQTADRFFACGAGEEAVDAAQTAKTIGCDFDAIGSDADDYGDAWQALLSDTRLPASTPSDPVILRLAERLKDNVDVALGGEGADEILCGYAAQHWVGEDFARYATIGCPTAAHFRHRLALDLGRESFRSPVDLFLAGNSFLRSEIKPYVLSHDAWQAAEQDQQIETVYEAAAASHLGESASRQIYRLIHRINLEGQLARLDTATMHASLEARVPFTDHLLCQQMAQVSFDKHIRIREGSSSDQTAAELAASQSLDTKRLLRVVAGDRLPEAIVRRPKKSFPTPVFEWMGSVWSDSVKETLAGSSFLHEIIQPELIDQLSESPASAGVLLWPLMNLAHWGDQEFAA